MKRLVSCLVLAMLVLAGNALATIPDLSNSYYTFDPAAEGATVLVRPDGSGAFFDEARDPSGNQVDATITLYLIDESGIPIYLYPFEDLWLESAAGGLSLCPGGTVADHSTDQLGSTDWRNPLRAGGCSFGEGTYIMISGSPMNWLPPVPVDFVSPDITGDLVVNLPDIVAFSQALGSDDPCADFNRNGQVDLTDIVIMAQAIGVQCP